MSEGKLYIGTRRYSSWSMRGWLLVKLAKLEVDEILIPLKGGNTEDIRKISPNGLVPYLEHRDAKIWESLAIAEYCAELEPALWPAGRSARAYARAIAAQMHAGFRDLRIAMPMNLGRNYAGLGQTPGALADIAQIDRLWTHTREQHGAGGPYLFGAGFTAADAMYAPVVARFLTYGVPLSKPAQAYCDAVRANALVAQWYAQAAEEPAAWQLEKYESLA